MEPLQIIPPEVTGEIASTDTNFRSCFRSWNQLVRNRSEYDLPAGETHFGFVHRGGLRLTCCSGEYVLSAGMFFRVPGSCQLEMTTEDSSGFVASRSQLQFEKDFGFFLIGGPVENTGRLQYIDGCSDTLLVSPAVVGDPCLNLLYLPPRTEQTAHTHPSCRMGMIVAGSGVCRAPNHDFALEPGVKFLIEPNAEHSFHTQDEALRVIAWHPDSDHGPTNDDHPMINRTIIGGVAASELRKSNFL